MLLNINEIKVNEGRRAAAAEAIDALVASIREVGMMNPITVTADHVLVAGLHRLEAAKRLGWAEIDCHIIDADSLHAELAEIDENYVRASLTPLESSKLLLRRKEIYEQLHPETKCGTAQGNGMKRAAAGETDDADLADKLSARSKPFAEDTAEKLGIDPRTVRRQVQIAKDLTPEAQQIIEDSGKRVTQQNLSKLCKLDPERQKEAAGQLVSGEIKSADEYSQHGLSAAEKPQGYNGTFFMTEFGKFRERFLYQMEDYGTTYETNFLELTGEQISDLEFQMDGMLIAIKKLMAQIRAAAAQCDENTNTSTGSEDETVA